MVLLVHKALKVILVLKVFKVFKVQLELLVQVLQWKVKLLILVHFHLQVIQKVMLT